jgi:hypothetical protein
MKQLFAVLVVGNMIAGPTPAFAAGCLKGAVVGGVAGHFAGRHGVIGAMTGCAVGHHMAAKAKREKLHQEQQQQPQPHG